MFSLLKLFDGNTLNIPIKRRTSPMVKVIIIANRLDQLNSKEIPIEKTAIA